ncbi:MAG: phospho-N-acetylmuramoyl-pentapeptide-transferase [Clostridiales bacterium]|nr:phospho-N-acetylmuramoyl-pentapeptide-transferase [Clostridiales bacterium]
MNIYLALAFAGLLSFAISFVLGFALIPWLRKLKFGQQIIENEGPVWHKSKQGTPTMGGIMFIISTVISTAVVLVTDKLLGGHIFEGEGVHAVELRVKLIAGIALAIGFGIIGFADDYIKVVKKRNLGLTVIQKTVAQLLLMAGYLLTLTLNHQTGMMVPFFGYVELSWFSWIFGICVIYGTVNAVNFTDGIDGLCAGVTSVTAIAFIVAAVMSKFLGIGVLSAALFGGCVGYLIWNYYPAKVMMGDTGSMFLGGLVVALAYAINCPLILLLFGILYVIEGLSDVLQIGYFKLTHGKRIFKMAPIHHHFEMCGWKERKIVSVFALVNAIGCAIGIVIYYFGIVKR